MRLIHLALFAVAVWAGRHVAREVITIIRATFAPAPAPAPTSSELVCATSGCHTTATDLVETPAGRILPRCGRCAEEMEARGMTV